MDYEFISTQIGVSKNDKALIELLDKLRPAPVDKYAHLHAQSDVLEDGSRLYSNIGIRLVDYSNGTGTNKFSVEHNIAPTDIDFFLEYCKPYVTDWSYQTEKIFGEADAQGCSTVTKLKIQRVHLSNKGEVRRYPWFITCENGVGVKLQNAKGGMYCKRDSYQCALKTTIALSDQDWHRLLTSAKRYIRIWESLWGPPLLHDGKVALSQLLERKRQTNGGQDMPAAA